MAKKQKPEFFRVTVAGEGCADVDVDWIRIYSGEELLGNEYFGAADKISRVTDFSKTVMDPETALSAALAGATVFMTNGNTFYHNGEKRSYTGESTAVEIEGRPYISLDMLTEVTGSAANFNNETNVLKINGTSFVLSQDAVVREKTIYLPLESVSEQVLNKVLTWDGRGCAILANRAFDVQRDHYVDRHIQFRDADLIYRFMQFDNPVGTDMIALLKKNMPDNQHPRILWTANNITEIKAKISAQNQWKTAYDDLIDLANKECLKDNTAAYQALTADKQKAARSMQEAIVILARAYLLSGDTKYAQKGIEILNGLIGWTYLDFEMSNLISGHWMAAIAIGYDSFYNYIDTLPEGETIRQDICFAVHELAMLPVYRAYCGDTEKINFITLQDNFAGVCGGGLMALLIAIADEAWFPDIAAYLLENGLKTLETAACLFYPDGAYYESVGYSQYMNENFSLALLGMKNCFGTYYGLDRVKGFTGFGYSLTFLQTAKTNVNYHDGSNGYVSDSLREIWSYLFADPLQAALAKRQKDLRGHKYSLEELFFYSKVVEGRELEITSKHMNDLGMDRYFFSAETGAFSSSMEDAEPVFAGFHGGRSGLPHDMLDLGEFIFESDGIKWATDFGSDSYALEDYFKIPQGYQYYLKQPQGKNCIVLNPRNAKELDGTEYYGQKIGARAELVKQEMNRSRGAMAVYDLTEAYQRDVTAYQRGYYFGDERQTLTVQDELVLKNENTELYWFMHVPLNTSINITEDGKKAFLTNNGKSLVVEMQSKNAENAKFEVMQEKPIVGELKTNELNINSGAYRNHKKLAVHAEDLNGKVSIAVKLMPDESLYSSYEALQLIPITEWKVPCEKKILLTKTGDVYHARAFLDSKKTDSVTLVLAAYTQKGQLLSVHMEEQEIKIGSNSLVFSFSDKDAALVKAFVWSDASEMVPLFPSVQYP